jgi:archaellum component FlaF (FlaF/FlaG flagellin family)
MGFGPVIATAISIVVLIAAGYVLIGGMAHSADITTATMKSAGDLKNQQLKTSLMLDGAAGYLNGSLSVAVHNTGSEKITNVSQMDVILTFTDQGSDIVDSYWVPAQEPGQTTGTYWRNAGIDSPTGDAINPGILDPGETLSVEVVSDTGFPANIGTVTVGAPDGVTASTRFILT